MAAPAGAAAGCDLLILRATKSPRYVDAVHLKDGTNN
jgi:hypothetical protein